MILRGEGHVQAVDRRSGRALSDAVVPETVLTGHLVATDEGVWVEGDTDPALVHVSAKTGAVDRSLRLPSSLGSGDLAWDGHWLWLVTSHRMTQIS